MQHIPIAICGTNVDGIENVIEQLRPKFQVVAIFATIEAALADLPAMLAYNPAAQTDHDNSSDEKKDPGDSRSASSTSCGMVKLPTISEQSLLLERALELDTGTLLLSPTLLNLAGLPERQRVSAIQGVVIGAAFLSSYEKIRSACIEAGGQTTWLLVDINTKQCHAGKAKLENLGTRLRKGLARPLTAGVEKDNIVRHI